MLMQKTKDDNPTKNIKILTSNNDLHCVVYWKEAEEQHKDSLGTTCLGLKHGLANNLQTQYYSRRRPAPPSSSKLKYYSQTGIKKVPA